ncbi:DUF3425 domain-containing protein [Aspergillus melleus]|uniref:DUF3425 domain-containing protein n=1 Tax=Aspergillus melleus TaxID=138277 RepID=UPI001E8D25E2|nr:uncharacterized protein LDX57_000227 [Aspergillus melleus]KAH8422474.1 hypothetical protein LDX57_000227 [Aspergillus melleus]
MRQRPSQIRIIHKPLIDFIVWPGLRERLVLFPHQHCSAKFWNLFWHCFRFDWPYTLEDACLQHSQSGLYQFSGTFTHHFFDLQRWRMTSSFVEEFPDLEPDVNVVPSVSGSASPAMDEEGFLTGLEELVHADEPQLEALPASFFTDLQSMDWPASRSSMF